MTLQNELPPLQPANQKPQQGTMKYTALFIILFVLLGMEGYVIYRMYGQKKRVSAPTVSRIATPTVEQQQPPNASPTPVPLNEQIVASAPQNISIESIDSYFTEVQKELDNL